MSTFTITSESFVNGGIIDIQYKNQVQCDSANRSLHVAWDIDDYTDIIGYELIVEKVTSVSSGNSPDDRVVYYNPGTPGAFPNGQKELLWYVRNIHYSVDHLGENEVWSCYGLNIEPTDNPLGGDRVNGWNGP